MMPLTVYFFVAFLIFVSGYSNSEHAATAARQEDSEHIHLTTLFTVPLQSEVELAEVFAVRFNHSTGIAGCEVCVSLPSISDQNSKIVKGFAVTLMGHQ
jgi:hypothetical protein